MKEIKLQALSIRNFKGCQTLELAPEGRSVALYGDNATGKTTVYDALTWLLFGKDSRGRSDFELKPLAPDGSVKDHAAVTEVAAVLNVDGTELELRRTYFERWSVKRGGSEASFDGNTSEFFVDGVPVQKNEFSRRVGELVDEELFRLLTGVTYFCEGLSWQERRRTLLSMCDVPEDRLLMAGEERFAPLAQDMGTLGLEEYKKKLTARRKALSGARSTIPARLDEQKKLIATLEELDFSADEAAREKLSGEIEKLSGELTALGHGSLLDARRNEARHLELELAGLRHENEVHRTSQNVPVPDERPGMEAALDQIKGRLARSAEAAEGEKKVIETIRGGIDEAREKWKAIDAERFTASVCPTCGQTLPEDAQQEAKRRFDEQKEARKADAVKAADLLKKELAAAQQRREKWIADAVAAENEAAMLADKLAAYVPEAAPVITDLPDFEKKSRALTAQLSKAQDAVAALEGESENIRREITAKLAAMKRELAELDGRLARKGLLDMARARQEELRSEAQAAAEELEAVDRRLYLCDEFTRFKVGFLQESVNARFALCRWKLFDEQVNGALADCCEATVNGVPYGSLNSGMRINAGIDVIRTVSQQYGVRVPLVVDNAESVSALLGADTQVIRLVVSAGDKELRCEYED